MSQYVETNTKTWQSDEALSQFRCVKMDADGKVTYADAADDYDGITDKPALTSGDPVAVRLRNATGTAKVTASEAITAGEKVYGAADGKVGATGTLIRGKALEAATADGDIIEIQQQPQLVEGVDTVASAGSAQGDAAALTATINTVTGADGTKGVVLPAAAAGLRVDVYNSVATNGLKIYPASGDDINDGTANAAITIEGKTLARFVGIDTSTWAAAYTVNT